MLPIVVVPFAKAIFQASRLTKNACGKLDSHQSARRGHGQCGKQLSKVRIVLTVAIPPLAGKISTLAGRAPQLTIVVKVPFGKL